MIQLNDVPVLQSFELAKARYLAGSPAGQDDWQREQAALMLGLAEEVHHVLTTIPHLVPRYAAHRYLNQRSEWERAMVDAIRLAGGDAHEFFCGDDAYWDRQEFLHDFLFSPGRFDDESRAVTEFGGHLGRD